MSAKRYGNPVCPEKKRSDPRLNNRPISLGAVRVSSGEGPIWVRVIKNARVMTKSATVFATKAIPCGLLNTTIATKITNNTVPAQKAVSILTTGMLSKIKSVTGLPLLAEA